MIRQVIAFACAAIAAAIACQTTPASGAEYDGPGAVTTVIDRPRAFIGESLGETEGDRPKFKSRAEIEREIRDEQNVYDRAIQEYSARKLSNMRISIAIYSNVYREIKAGSAGIGQYDDLVQSHAFLTPIDVAGNRIWLPSGGIEISYMGAPLYQVVLGASYDLYSGINFRGNQFTDWFVSTFYIGLKINLINERVAMQDFGAMLDFSSPEHFTGLNIYIKATAGLSLSSPVNYEGPLAPSADSGYFRQTAVGSWFVGAGFEYRIFTVGFFLETGYSVMQHPKMTQPGIKANHFRCFPVQAGLNVYFGG